MSSAWTFQAVGTGPAFTADAAKMTYTRAGWDAPRQRVWYVDFDNSLWLLNPATLAWTRETTTGSKPDQYAVFARHEAGDRIVAWVGEAYIASQTGAPMLRKTYLLNPSTLVWSELATPTIPPGVVVVAQRDGLRPRQLARPSEYRLRFLTGDVAADAVGRHPAYGTPAGSAAIDSAAIDSTANATSNAPAAPPPPPSGACLPTAPKTFTACETPSRPGSVPVRRRQQRPHVDVGLDPETSYMSG